MDRNKDEEIRKRAHQIWEDEGRPDGKEAEHWDRAAREVGPESERRDAGKTALGGLAEGSKTERTAGDLKSGKEVRRR